MAYTTLDLVVADKVATITLNRPDVRNAFNETTIAELALAFDEVGRNEFVRAVVLAANGPAFCAGADLNWMKKMAGYSHAENNADAMQLADMLRTIYLCPKPVVARVQGDCYAGGMGLVSACDIVVAVADRAVSDPADVLAALGGERIGQPIVLRVARGGKDERVTVTVGERPRGRR